MSSFTIRANNIYSLPQYQKSAIQFSSVQSLSLAQLFATPWATGHKASLSITSSWSIFELMSIESVMPFNHLILCHPLLLLPSIFPSIRVFSNEPVLHIKWPKYWSFSFSISPSNKYAGLISFRIDWFALLAVQGTLKSLLQHHSSKASIFWHSAFFIIQLSHPYMTTGKTIALIRQIFVSKEMSLLSNTLSVFQFSSVQSLSCVQGFVTPWTAARQASLPKTWSLLELKSVESVMPSNHLIPYCPLLLRSSIFPSIRVFSYELVLCIRWPIIGVSASATVFPMNTQD